MYCYVIEYVSVVWSVVETRDSKCAVVRNAQNRRNVTIKVNQHTSHIIAVGCKIARYSVGLI